MSMFDEIVGSERVFDTNIQMLDNLRNAYNSTRCQCYNTASIVTDGKPNKLAFVRGKFLREVDHLPARTKLT